MSRYAFAKGIPESIYEIRLVAGETRHGCWYWLMQQCF